MWTTHGHHIDGTPMSSEDRPKSVARCGGPGLCARCSQEAALAKGSLEAVKQNMYDVAPIAKILGLVSGLIVQRGFNREENAHHLAFPPIKPGPEFQVFVVSFCFILGGYKATVSSTLPDSRYYEVTYNSAKLEHYIDVYVKAENHAIADGPLHAPLN